MRNYIDNIIKLLSDINDALQKIVPITFIDKPPFAEWKIYSKQDVMKIMNMT